jgi:hypothetical protein
MQDDKQSALEERMQALMLEDNVGSAATVCARYPRLGGKRELSKFEMDLRDWGLCCGITFGLARAESPDEATRRSLNAHIRLRASRISSGPVPSVIPRKRARRRYAMSWSRFTRRKSKRTKSGAIKRAR